MGVFFHPNGGFFYPHLGGLGFFFSYRYRNQTSPIWAVFFSPLEGLLLSTSWGTPQWRPPPHPTSPTSLWWQVMGMPHLYQNLPSQRPQIDQKRRSRLRQIDRNRPSWQPQCSQYG